MQSFFLVLLFTNYYFIFHKTTVNLLLPHPMFSATLPKIHLCNVPYGLSYLEIQARLQNGIVECQLKGSPWPTEILIFGDSLMSKNLH